MHRNFRISMRITQGLILLIGIGVARAPAQAPQPSLEQQLDTIQARAGSAIASLGDTAKSLLTAIDTMKKELETTRAERDALKDQISVLNKTKTDAERNLSGALKEKEELRLAFVRAADQNDQKEKELNAAVAEKEEAQKRTLAGCAPPPKH